jgi:excisionase family DNA binding protein
MAGEYIGPREAAALLGVHHDTARRWMRSGKLPGWRRGGRLLTTRAAALAMLVPTGGDVAGPAPGAEAAMEGLRRRGLKV